MKRIAFLTAALLLVMSILTSCIIPLNKKFRFKKERVESIEVYDLCQCKNTEGSSFLETESQILRHWQRNWPHEPRYAHRFAA